jgi:hypothetical protein
LRRRAIKTRTTLLEVIKGNNIDSNAEDEDTPFGIQLPEIPELRVEIPSLYVRNDGTVDWDGALQDREALKEFGSAVWARINGRNPSSLEDGEKGAAAHGDKSAENKSPVVTAKIKETPEIVEARNELTRLSEEFGDMQFAHTALLSSGTFEVHTKETPWLDLHIKYSILLFCRELPIAGIRAGQAVANVKLASLDPDLRNRIRESAEALALEEQKVSFQTLIYELERIYTYFATELENPATNGYVPLQDRLNVAEFGLLESQIESFHRELDKRGTIDEDVLAVVMEQLTDFKRRLGIDYYVTGLTYDREAILTWLNDILRKTKGGLAFYVKGCQLFWDDVVFCSSLIGRAAQGYTLKPREVRNIR